MIDNNSIVGKIQNDLKKITNQNVICDLEKYNLTINLEYEPIDKVQRKIVNYIYSHIPCGLNVKINIRSEELENE